MTDLSWRKWKDGTHSLLAGTVQWATIAPHDNGHRGSAWPQPRSRLEIKTPCGRATWKLAANSAHAKRLCERWLRQYVHEPIGEIT